jgi:hypothetical protein
MLGARETEPSALPNDEAGAPAQGLPKSRRMRVPLRLSVRGLLFLIVVIACGLAWFAHAIREGNDQRAHVNAIYRVGGWVVYDCDWIGEPNPGSFTPKWPRWLLDEVGREYLSNVVFVNLHDRGNDAVMADIGRLTRLKQLHRVGPAVTDAGIARLQALRRLELLSLQNSQVTDAGIKHLNRLTSLKWLGLTRTKVSDAGISKLKEALPTLQIQR